LKKALYILDGGIHDLLDRFFGVEGVVGGNNDIIQTQKHMIGEESGEIVGFFIYRTQNFGLLADSGLFGKNIQTGGSQPALGQRPQKGFHIHCVKSGCGSFR